jgi:nicotinamide-nucleotide amidase
MTADVISIGDELLIGQVVNTNAARIAQLLQESGIPVRQITVVSDDRAHIMAALDESMEKSRFIMVTGGLGPTRDDITKHTLADYFATELVFHHDTFEHIKSFFAQRGIAVTERNRGQAMLPVSCTPLSNPHGTAPGMWFERESRIVVSMPGVPYEMEPMMVNHVLPRLRSLMSGTRVISRTVLTTGVGESFIADRIRKWEEDLPGNCKLAYLPQPGIVRLRLTINGQPPPGQMASHSFPDLESEINGRISELVSLIPDLVFGYGEDLLEAVIGRMLLNRKLTLSTAESCTGGYLASLLTAVPGASAYFKGSVVAYANQAKIELLGVDEKALAEYGAVSETTAREMARGAKLRFGSDYAIALTGIAGPDGETPEKPVGLVWIALAGPVETVAEKFLFGDHRQRNIRKAALAGLNMLRLALRP